MKVFKTELDNMTVWSELHAHAISTLVFIYRRGTSEDVSLLSKNQRHY